MAKISFKLRALLFFVLFAVTGTLSHPASASLPGYNAAKYGPSLYDYGFPTPQGLEPQVNFWIDIYSKYTTDYAVIHDADNVEIIYEVVYLGSNKSRRSRDRKLRKIKSKYKTILRKLAKKKNRAFLTGEEKRVHDLVKNGFYRAARVIRSQIGQKDRFEGGLIRSGKYMDQIWDIFKAQDLPVELSVLPHVESSFQENAYSSAGAAGIWQFTRGTGRLFMRVKYDVDERRDPIMSTHAAAKLLRSNYERLRSWPLAITAYNHGTRGMARAKKRHGDDIVKIIKKYRSRTFGFASRNFYAEFLAALHVVRNENKYFPNLRKETPIRHVSIRFDDYVHISSIMRHFDMTRQEVAKYNPALRKPVISGQKRIPRGFVFQAPARRFDDLAPFYQKISTSEKFGSQIRSKWYTVQRGDTLSGLALRFGTSVREMKQLNQIGRRNRIYVGKVLRVPPARKSRRSNILTVKASPKLQKQVEQPLETGRYRVRRHDNLTKIAKRFKTKPYTLARLNGIKRANSIYPGQILKVPDPVKAAKPVVLAKADPVPPASTPVPPKTKKTLPVPVKSTKKKKVKSKLEESALTTAQLKGEAPVVSDSAGDLEPGVKVQLAKATVPAYQMNTNRPAFLPVAFKNKEHEASRMGVITVDFDETLSHYAEWAQYSLRKLRRINKIRRRSHIPVHTKILVPMTNTDPEKFDERRQEFHKAIQDDFFSNFKVSKLVVREVRKGETLWEICNDMYFIPFWLLSTYNPDKDINNLSVGEPLKIPIIIPIKSKDS